MSIRRKLPTPSAGWTGTAVRLLFGAIFANDAVLKWLPGYRKTYISQLKAAAVGQPSWLHGWFHFWIRLQSSAPTFFATLPGVTETALALVLVFGIARRAGYSLGIIYSLLVWAVGEVSAVPTSQALLTWGQALSTPCYFSPCSPSPPRHAEKRMSADHLFISRWPWWRVLGEPHAVDRVSGAPLVEPVTVGKT